MEMRNADRHNGAGGGAPRQAHHVGEKNCNLSALCLHGAFSCKMLDEKICRAVVVTFAVALQQKLLKQALSLFEIARSCLEVSSRQTSGRSGSCGRV